MPGLARSSGLRARPIHGRFGKGLKADLAGLWRYRVGGCYRILCQIRDRELLVLVVAVGHRREVYE